MENLGIDGKLLIAQIINFALFFYLYKKFIAAPFSNFLKSEVRKNEEKEQLLENAKKSEEDRVKEEVDFQKKMKKESSQVIVNAKKEAQTIREDMITEAQKDIEAMKTSARKQIEAENEQNKKEMERKILDLSAIALQKTLEQDLDEATKKQLTGKILNNLGQ